MSVKKTELKEKPDNGKSRALGLAVEQIEKQFGSGSIMRLGDAHKIDVETFSIGSLSLDIALGGGLPKGRIIEIYGPESSGKTTLTLHAIASIQKMAVPRRLWMPNMRLILNMLKGSELTLRNC